MRLIGRRKGGGLGERGGLGVWVGWGYGDDCCRRMLCKPGVRSGDTIRFITRKKYINLINYFDNGKSAMLVGCSYNILVAKFKNSLIFRVGCTPWWQTVLGIILKLRHYSFKICLLPPGKCFQTPW